MPSDKKTTGKQILEAPEEALAHARGEPNQCREEIRKADMEADMKHTDADDKQPDRLWDRRQIPRFEGVYEIDAIGNVYSLPRNTTPGGIKKSHVARNGYKRIVLFRDGKQYNESIHRLVCEAWHGPCPEGKECAHLDGDRLNNHYANLQWVTRKDNHAMKKQHGTWQGGENNSFAKFSERQIRGMRALSALGFATSEIAEMFRSKTEVIWSILDGKTWGHIDCPITKLRAQVSEQQQEIDGLSENYALLNKEAVRLEKQVKDYEAALHLYAGMQFTDLAMDRGTKAREVLEKWNKDRA